MIKNRKRWEMPKKLRNAKVYERHFSGVKVGCIKDYMKSSLTESPDHFVLQVGTNELDLERQLNLTAIDDGCCSSFKK